MKDKERITNWINNVLDGLSELDGDQGIKLMQKCGAECCKASELFKNALVFRKNYKGEEDSDIIFNEYKKAHYNSPNFTKEGKVMTLIFEECTCPMAKEGVNNPFLCYCTTGYAKEISEALFKKTVEVKLVESILNGDKICKQEITIIE